MDVKEVREALERGLDKEHLKKASDAMECMTTHRWYWRWAQNLESNCKEALAALSAVDPDAIRAEKDTEIAKLRAKQEDLRAVLTYARAVLPAEKWTDDTKRMIDAALADKE